MGADRLSSSILRDLRSVDVRTVPALRPIRRKWSKELASASPQEILQVARGILASGEAEFRFIAYELVHFHKPARKSLQKGEVEVLAHEMQSWDAVDAFSYYISGPAWRDGQISDDVMAKWAASKNRWWRRASLASTIPLSRRHTPEDIERVLSLCALLVADRDDMVVKAMSWALREVARQNPSAATQFVDAYGDALAPRVLREVKNKLQTGLKNPRRKTGRT